MIGIDETPVEESERRPGSWRRRAWVAPVLLFVLFTAVYGATAERSSASPDVFAASVEAWHIGSTGSPWLDDVELDDLSGSHWWTPPDLWLGEAPNGHVVALRMGGPIIIGIPFYAVLGHGHVATDFALWPGAIAAAVVTALAVTLMYLALRRLVSERLAVVGALVFGLATPTWAVSANGLWTHTVTQLGLAGVALSLARRSWWLAGTFFGVAMLGRPHIALVAAVVGLGCAYSERRLRPAVAIGLPSIAALLVLEAWNHAVFGTWSPGGAYGDQQFTQVAEGVGGDGANQWVSYLGFLVSANRGFLVWSPALLVLLPAIVRAWRVLPSWTKWLPLGGLAYSVAQMRLNHFSGGEGFFAYRHGLELLTCLFPLVVMSVPWAGRTARLLLPPAIALQFGAMAFGAVVEGAFVPMSQAWTHNGLVVAAQEQPVMVLGWLTLCLIAGILVSLRLRDLPVAQPSLPGTSVP